MVNFDKLGKRVSEDRFTRIDEPWDQLPDKTKQVIKTLHRHPAVSQSKIAELADVTASHVHDIIFSLPPEQFEQYRGDIILDSNVTVAPDDTNGFNNDGTVTVVKDMHFLVEVTLNQEDLAEATVAAMYQQASD